MTVRIRLAVHGLRNSRYFDIVAIHGTKARNAKPLEKLGEFNPRPVETSKGGKEKRVEWSVERIRYWLGVGAQPSKTVLRLFEEGGILPKSAASTSETAPIPAVSRKPQPTPLELMRLRHNAGQTPRIRQMRFM